MRKPRFFLALLLFVALLVLPAAAVAEDKEPSLVEKVGKCLKPSMLGTNQCATEAVKKVTGKGAKALEGTPVGGLASAVDKLASAADKLASFSPQGMVDEWAKSIGEFAVRTVGWIGDRITKITSPQFDSPGWLKQYAVAAGLGFLMFAFMLTVVAARVARISRDSVDRVQLLRDAGISAWAVPVAIIAGPAILTTVGGAFSDVGAVFGGEVKQSQATDRLAGLVEPLTSSAGDWAPLGGVAGALLVFLVVGVVGLYVLVLMYFVSEMTTIFGLLIPIALAFWTYAPWRSITRRIVAGLIALMLMPTVLQFVFWAVWTRVGTTEVTGIDAAMRLLVGLGILASVPTLAMMFLPKFMPDGQAAPTAALSLGGGAMAGAYTARMLTLQSKRDGHGQNRAITPAPPGAMPPGHTGPPSAGGVPPKPGGRASGKRAAHAQAGGSKGAAVPSASPMAAGGTSAAGGKAAAAAGGPTVASAAAVALGARALKQAGSAGSSSSAGIADVGGAGGRRPEDR